MVKLHTRASYCYELVWWKHRGTRPGSDPAHIIFAGARIEKHGDVKRWGMLQRFALQKRKIHDISYGCMSHAKFIAARLLFLAAQAVPAQPSISYLFRTRLGASVTVKRKTELLPCALDSSEVRCVSVLGV